MDSTTRGMRPIGEGEPELTGLTVPQLQSRQVEIEARIKTATIGQSIRLIEKLHLVKRELAAREGDAAPDPTA